MESSTTATADGAGSGGRARAVNALWNLKRLCDARAAAGMPMIHFKMLLADPEYREDILQRAESLGDSEVRVQVAQIRAMKLQGALARESAAPAASRPPPVEPHVQAIPAQNRGSHASPIIITAVALAAILGLAYYLLPMGQRAAAGPKTVQAPQQILENTTWEAGNTYVLSGPTFVEKGARLTIQPGVQVRGQPGSALFVTRGSTIHARGTAAEPVVFSSNKPVGRRAPGDWGGVVLLGDAPTNRRSNRIEGLAEADARGEYGGANATSSCGVLDYVRIEFAGYEISKDNELNGLTLGGCGSGTIVRNVQVHRGLDDGIEVFGGTVDLKRVLVSGAGDDAFDWDRGWQGRAQYVLLLLYPNMGDNGFEGDNYKVDNDAQPRSAPTFYNVTMLAAPDSTRVHRGMTLRRGSGGRFHNVIISGFNGEAVDLRDAGVGALSGSGELDFAGVLLHEIGPDGRTPFADEAGDADDDGGFDESAFLLAEGRAAVVRSVGLLPGALTRGASDLVPSAVDLPLTAVTPPQDEFWDEGARFIGAIPPGGSGTWVEGWTAFPEN